MAKKFSYATIVPASGFLAFSGVAQAQVSGVYAGMNSHGNPLQFTVSVDSNSGAATITAVLLYYYAPCGKSGEVYNQGVAFSPNTPIVNKTASYQSYYISGYTAFQLTFSADNQLATGSATVILPAVNTTYTPPRSSLICFDRNEKLNLTLQPAADRTVTVHQ